LRKIATLEKLQKYAQVFGFGERAGWEIEREPEGAFPKKAPPARAGGVGKIASFGQGISVTLFQLASFTSALANGGTLYYLQYLDGLNNERFEPKVKRDLGISSWLPAVEKGLETAVLKGTARRAKQQDIHLLGKTGTCSENRARLGWFAGYSQEPAKLAIVVMLRTRVKLGGGPKASEVAGRVFRILADQDFFARYSVPPPPLPPTFPATIQIPGLP
jgi:cell division protein FtsI/penicillin-binding protein 2